jgi:ketosteroid isomerase-like protein
LTAARSDDEKIAVVRRSFEGLNAGDLDAVFACCHEDCVFDASRIAEGVFEGEASYRKFLQDVLDTVAPHHHELRYEVRGDLVLATARMKGTGQASGIETGMPVAYVHEVRDGLIARQATYPDVEEGVAAFRSGRVG